MGGLYDAATLHAPLMDKIKNEKTRQKLESTLVLENVKSYGKRTSPWQFDMYIQCPYSSARLAQSAERKALNLVVVGSSPTVGVFDSLYGNIFLHGLGTISSR